MFVTDTCIPRADYGKIYSCRFQMLSDSYSDLGVEFFKRVNLGCACPCGRQSSVKVVDGRNLRSSSVHFEPICYTSLSFGAETE